MKQRNAAKIKQRLIRDLRTTMEMMQDDPDFECVDTVSVMEDVISDALFYFTGERHCTHDKEDAVLEKELEGEV